jgi:hypothetical protein
MWLLKRIKLPIPRRFVFTLHAEFGEPTGADPHAQARLDRTEPRLLSASKRKVARPEKSKP